MISQQNSGQSLELSKGVHGSEAQKQVRWGDGWDEREQLEVECELAQDVVVDSITCLIQMYPGALQPQEVRASTLLLGPLCSQTHGFRGQHLKQRPLIPFLVPLSGGTR